jgi:hypothetical protein
VACGLSLGLSQAVSPAYAASAAPVAHQVAGTHGGLTVAAIPFIQERDCSGQTTHWVNIDFITSAGLVDRCYGYTGTWHFYAPNDLVTAFCAGNNSGVFKYTENHQPKTLNFKPLTVKYWPNSVQADSLEITGWGGNDTCTS